MDKKEFQKFVKKYRGEGEEFPKAMMHGSQIRKRTATINCGRKNSKELAKKIVSSSEFDSFIKGQNARHIVEKKSDDFYGQIEQIRIYW